MSSDKFKQQVLVQELLPIPKTDYAFSFKVIRDSQGKDKVRLGKGQLRVQPDGVKSLRSRNLNIANQKQFQAVIDFFLEAAMRHCGWNYLPKKEVKPTNVQSNQQS